MSRLCGGVHEISGIPAPLCLCGSVVRGFMGWVGGGGVGGWRVHWVGGGGVGGWRIHGVGGWVLVWVVVGWVVEGSWGWWCWAG